MCISGLALFRKVMCTSFMHLLNLYGAASDVWEVCRAFKALEAGVLKLQHSTMSCYGGKKRERCGKRDLVC